MAEPLPEPVDLTVSPWDEGAIAGADGGDRDQVQGWVGDGDGDDGGRWHLGIDLGTTGLTMVLRDRGANRAYPLYWRSPDGQQFQDRLPTVAWLRREQGAARSLADPQVRRGFLEPLPVGFEALDQAAIAARTLPNLDLRTTHGPDQPGLLLENFVPDLQDALPWTLPGTADLEPRIWPPAACPPEDSIAFQWLGRAAAALLATPFAEPGQGRWTVGATDLDAATLAAALGTLATVTFTEPVGATAAYRFNLREAAIAAGLVTQPAQVAFVAEPLAALAGWLGESPSDDAIAQGAILSVRVGASGGGFALASGRLPERVILHGFRSGGHAMTDDALYQLLCPTDRDRAALGLAEVQPGQDATPSPNPLPTPAQDDRPQRRRLRQRLARSPDGRTLLGLAERLKGQLQGIENLEVGLALGDRTWRISPQIWQEQVMGPWIERFNHELNQLLGRGGIAPERVDRVLCSGGVGSMVPVVRWLRQKFPWAEIIAEAPALVPDATVRTAAGAARWAELPPALVPAPQPYDDYFLFGELLRAVPETPIAIADLWRQLDERGINTRGSGDRLYALLRGDLPRGLIPTPTDGSAVIPASRDRPDYAQLRDHYPFQHSQDTNTYWRDREASFHWQRYLSSLWARGHQGMVEPIADCPDPLAIG
ncbi:MAG: hypothetical protein Fur0042_30230 [Cyanophyceae cyanobacterium]